MALARLPVRVLDGMVQPVEVSLPKQCFTLLLQAWSVFDSLRKQVDNLLQVLLGMGLSASKLRYTLLTVRAALPPALFHTSIQKIRHPHFDRLTPT